MPVFSLTPLSGEMLSAPFATQRTRCLGPSMSLVTICFWWFFYLLGHGQNSRLSFLSFISLRHNPFPEVIVDMGFPCGDRKTALPNCTRFATTSDSDNFLQPLESAFLMRTVNRSNDFLLLLLQPRRFPNAETVSLFSETCSFILLVSGQN